MATTAGTPDGAGLGGPSTHGRRPVTPHYCARYAFTVRTCRRVMPHRGMRRDVPSHTTHCVRDGQCDGQTMRRPCKARATATLVPMLACTAIGTLLVLQRHEAFASHTNLSPRSCVVSLPPHVRVSGVSGTSAAETNDAHGNAQGSPERHVKHSRSLVESPFASCGKHTWRANRQKHATEKRVQLCAVCGHGLLFVRGPTRPP